MKFILNEYHRNTPNEELLDDLKKTAKGLGQKKLTTEEYNAHGKFSAATLIHRFYSWNKTLLKAGLEINRIHSITAGELFENLKKVWSTLRRHPLIKNMVKPLSAYSYSVYLRRFGSWRTALAEFIKYIEKEKINKRSAKTGHQNEVKSGKKFKQKVTCKKYVKNSHKHVSKSLRFDILKRDKFKCKKCGSSPAVNPKIILHVDHIKPFSKGGMTIPQNLQTLCSDCNYGKGSKLINTKK